MTGSSTAVAKPSATLEAKSRAKELVDGALNQLSEALSQGKSEALRESLAMLGRFHQYSLHNVFLIYSQKPDATRVAGFGTWKSLGRYVKKGEKGILILAPIVGRKKQKDKGDGDTNDDEDEIEVAVHFRGVYIFDVSQTEGEPLPAPAEVGGDPGAYVDRLKSFIALWGIVIDHDDVPLAADGVSRGGRISIRAGLSSAEEFSVLVHELAHELLHRGEDRPRSKTVRETEAEAVAFVVCHAIGLETNTAASDYIHLYDGKVETLTGSLDRIQRTATEVILAITDYENQ